VRQAKQAEVQIMGKTIAEALLEEGVAAGILEGKAAGILEGKRETLLRLLRRKFKRVPPTVTAEVQAAQDGRQLDDWLDAVLTADKISDMPFQSSKKK
jgi:hypothetical protein